MFHTWRRLIPISVVAFALLIAPGVQAKKKCNAKQKSGDVCPLKVGKQVYFNRCAPNTVGKASTLGNSVCDTLRVLNKAKNLAAGKNAQKNMISAARTEGKKTAQKAFDEIIGNKAKKEFKTAAKIPLEWINDVKKLGKDKTCGVKGLLKGTASWFKRQGGYLRQTGTAVKHLTTAIKQAAPIVKEVQGISKEMKALRKLAKQAKKDATKEFKKLEKAIDGLNEDSKTLRDLGNTGVNLATDGWTMVTGVGTWLGHCAKCSKGVEIAIADAVAGVAGCIGGSATVEIYGVGVAGWVECVIAAVKGAAVTWLSSSSCGEAARGVVRIVEYYNSILAFVDSAEKLANKVQGNIKNAKAALEALKKLGQSIGPKAKPHIKKIRGHLAKIEKAATQSKKTLTGKVKPAVIKLSGNLMNELGSNVQTMLTCHKKIDTLMRKISKDSLNALKGMAKAVKQIKAAHKTANALKKNMSKATKAAEKVGKNAYSMMKTQLDAAFMSAYGSPCCKVNVKRAFKRLLKLSSKKKRNNLRKLADKVEKIRKGQLKAAGKAALKAIGNKLSKAVNAMKKALKDAKKYGAQLRAAANKKQKKKSVMPGSVKRSRKSQDKAYRQMVESFKKLK